jgi:hypothetical protein
VVERIDIEHEQGGVATQICKYKLFPKDNKGDIGT